ncbi:MAG: pyridoxal-dependent decarboxylase [Spirochaetota bacterium]|nr:pyridoxal-dependent decarboxylase [Spirochaetota bacterium]
MKLLDKDVHRKDVIKADIEHLRKLFIMPDSPDKFLEFGYELLNLIHNFFTEKGGIHSEISLPELSKLFSNIQIPKSPQLLKDILSEIKDKIIAHSVKVGSPYYIGHMTSAIPYFMILLEMIIAALNQNQVKIETAKASTFVERELVAWIHKLIFNRSSNFYQRHIQNPDVALGNVTLDGTIANLTAMLVARNKAFPPKGRFPGIRKAGVYEALRHYNYNRAVIIVSNRGHYSFDKISRIIGIGENNIIKIPVNSDNKIDIHKLRQTCYEIKEMNKDGEDRTKIISLIGIAGTTETGNIDNLVEIRKIADEYNTFFHVDAAWGGAVLLVDQYRFLLNGIESADSVTFDAHKLLYTPLSMGLILFKEETALDYLKHTSEYIIRADSVDQGRFTVEGSRPFSCLKPWSTLKIFGTEGFKLLLEQAFDNINYLRRIIEENSNLEPINQPELFIYNYRFVPEEIQKELDSLLQEIAVQGKQGRNKLQKRVDKINTTLNELNIELHRKIRQEDNSFVSRTVLESTKYSPQRIVVLRAITINPLLTPEIMEEIINEHNQLGLKIYKSYTSSRF